MRWGAAGSCRGLTYKKRFLLLLDAAQGGSAEAVAQLSRSTGCLPNEMLFHAAAHAGNVEVCEWLLGQDIELQGRGAWVLATAAEAGHTALCEKLHTAGFRLTTYAMRLALRNGRRAVLDWMQGQGQLYEASPLELRRADMCDNLPEELSDNAAYGGQLELVQKLKGSKQAKPEDLPAVAHGCPLAVLQKLVEACLCMDPHVEVSASQRASIMAAAVTSPTTDWQAKVLWLLQAEVAPAINQLDKGRAGAAAFAALPDAPQRLEWLGAQGLGLQVSRELLHASAEAGRSELVLQLWSQAQARLREDPLWSVGNALVELAVQQGDLRLAQQLESQGAPVDAYELVLTAAAAGRLDSMRWAVQLLREEQAAAPADMDAGGGGEEQQQARKRWQQGTLGCRTEGSKPAGRCRGPRRALLRTPRCLRSWKPSSSWSRRASPAAWSWYSGCTRAACPWAVTQ